MENYKNIPSDENYQKDYWIEEDLPVNESDPFADNNIRTTRVRFQLQISH